MQATSVPPAETLGPRWFPLPAPQGPRALSPLTVGGPAFFCIFLHCSCHFTSGNQTQHFLLGDGSNLNTFLRNKYVLFHASKVFLHAQLAQPHIQLLQSVGASGEQLTVLQPFLNSAFGSWWNSRGPDDCRDPSVTIPTGLGLSWGKAACHLHISSTHRNVRQVLAPDASPQPPCKCCICLLRQGITQSIHFWKGKPPLPQLSGREETRERWCRRGFRGWGQLSPPPLSPLANAMNSNTKKHPVSAVVTSSPQLRHLEPYCLI